MYTHDLITRISLPNMPSLFGEAANELRRLHAALETIEMETRKGGQWTIEETNEFALKTIIER